MGISRYFSLVPPSAAGKLVSARPSPAIGAGLVSLPLLSHAPESAEKQMVVGSDRIAANGDVANKIGTYSLAVAARFHGVRFMVVAPTSTVDLAAETGMDIPIEERGPEEIWGVAGLGEVPPGVTVANPVFDITPAHLIDAIVTENGVASPPDAESLARIASARP